MTLTAAEVITSTKRMRDQQAKEEREFRAKRLEMEAYHDLRDDICSLIKNSAMTFEDIHAQCGPHPNTLHNWMEKKVSQPRMGKLRSTLKILGYDLAIVDGAGKLVSSSRKAS